MIDQLPTQKELTEFWEWCGFRSNAMKLSEGGWNYPNGGWDIRLPVLDLNNLFKWAVPKVRGIELKLVNMEKTGNLSGQYCSAQVQRKDTGELIRSGYQTDLCIAIFRAIQRVAGGSPDAPPPNEAIKP